MKILTLALIIAIVLALIYAVSTLTSDTASAPANSSAPGSAVVPTTPAQAPMPVSRIGRIEIIRAFEPVVFMGVTRVMFFDENNAEISVPSVSAEIVNPNTTDPRANVKYLLQDGGEPLAGRGGKFVFRFAENSREPHRINIINRMGQFAYRIQGAQVVAFDRAGKEIWKSPVIADNGARDVYSFAIGLPALPAPAIKQ